MGNYQSAQQSSNIAKILNYVGFAIGIFFWIVGAIYLIVSIGIATSNAYYVD